MARPSKSAAEKRALIVSFRVTPRERDALSAKALAGGVALSEFARAAALHRPLPPARQAQNADPAAFVLADQLRRVGVNLNQLTRLSHMGSEHNAMLVRLLGEIGAILDRFHRVEPGVLPPE